MGARNVRNRIVLLSGGLDSSAVLYLSDPLTTRALFVDYGQVSAAGERVAARRVCVRRGIELDCVQQVGVSALGAGSLAGRERAVDADGITDEQREEWFPGRNLLLGTVGAILLGRRGGGDLVFGASASGYRDSTPAFFAAMERAVAEALPAHQEPRVVFPEEDRREVLRRAVAAGLEPRITFSCNRRGDRHCWRCASCVDRLELLGDVSHLPGSSWRHRGGWRQR